MKKTTNLVWGGRFEYNSSNLLKKINNSISFDYNLADEDIKLNKSYAKSLFDAKILSSNELKKINVALDDIQQEVQNEKFKFSHDYEDIHMNIEMALKKELESWLKNFILKNRETTKLPLMKMDKEKIKNVIKDKKFKNNY